MSSNPRPSGPIAGAPGPHAWHKLYRSTAARLLALHASPEALTNPRTGEPLAFRGSALSPILVFLALLDEAALREEPYVIALPLRELSARTGLGRSTVSRALTTLEAGGLIARGETRTGNEPVEVTLLGPPGSPSYVPPPKASEPSEDSGKALSARTTPFQKVSGRPFPTTGTERFPLGERLSGNSEPNPLPSNGIQEAEPPLRGSEFKKERSPPYAEEDGGNRSVVKELLERLGGSPGEVGIASSVLSLEQAKTLTDEAKRRGLHGRQIAGFLRDRALKELFPERVDEDSNGTAESVQESPS